MDYRPTLQSCLDRAAPHTTTRAASIIAIEALARAAVDLAAMIAAGPLAGITGEAGALNADGDRQRDIDIEQECVYFRK